MPMSDAQGPKSAHEKLEELLLRARTMPRGGDLEGLLVREMQELASALQQQVLEEREKPDDASSQASFPPSGKPPQ
jgi:hypothetical protein